MKVITYQWASEKICQKRIWDYVKKISYDQAHGKLVLPICLVPFLSLLIQRRKGNSYQNYFRFKEDWLPENMILAAGDQM